MKNHIHRNSTTHCNKEDGIDRISDLPCNVIDDILCRMSIKEVAMMSVLSKTWNHIWSSHPIIVLDEQFYEMIDQRTFCNIVYKILLQHNGPIIKFVLDILSDDLKNSDIDHWLLHVSTRGVQELTIQNILEDPYIFPSFLFDSSSSKLRYFSITNCTFKLARDTSPFMHLVTINLCHITFDQILENNALVAPLLSTLKLTGCDGIQFLNIFAPMLSCLFMLESHFVDLKFLKAYPELKTLSISVSNTAIQNYEFWRRFNLLEFMCSFPKLMQLCFNTSFFKFVVPDSMPKTIGAPLEHLHTFGAPLEHLHTLMLGFTFHDLAQISAVIYLLQSAPQLHTLNIKNKIVTPRNGEVVAVTDYLTAPDCMDKDLTALEMIKLIDFESSSAELAFMKLLLARCPSLVEFTVKPVRFPEHAGVWSFYLELLEFPPASPHIDVLLDLFS